MSKIIGIDFGTSNSSVAVKIESDVKLVKFNYLKSLISILKSAIFFDSIDNAGDIEVGNNAIYKYTESLEGRLVKSLKNFLTDESFKFTKINNKNYTLDDLISLVISELKSQIEEQFGEISKDDKIYVGRPVKFVNQKSVEDEQLALNRIRKSFKNIKLENINFIYEPLAAAYNYAINCTNNEIVLVADLGGGTTDFCIMLVGNYYNKLPSNERILATGGIGIGGNALDGKIIYNSVCKQLGLGSKYLTYNNQELSIPHWFYTVFSNLANSNQLKEFKNLKLIKEVASLAKNKKQLENFMYIIENNLIFSIFETADQAKQQLSNHPEVEFNFEKHGINIKSIIQRDDFNLWISPELEKIKETAIETINIANLTTDKINKVFLTGGTSLVPAVKSLFVDLFDQDKIIIGDEFTSVTKGLVLTNN